MAKVKIETIDEHIKNNFYNQADFARKIGTSPQHVVKWKINGYIVINGILCKRIKDEHIVVDGVLCKKMRDLTTAKS